MTMQEATGLAATLASKAESPEVDGVRQRTIREMLSLDSTKAQVAAALPGSLDPERFVRICLTVLRQNDDLNASGATSFLGAVMTAASLGLEFGALQEVYLVPFKDHGVQETQLIIGYRGYIKLLYRSGLVRDVAVRPVYEGDQWDYWYDETGDHMIHRPVARSKDRGDIATYYSRVILTNGGMHLHVMTPEDIEERARRSATRDSKRSPWKTDHLPMALKTVLRAQVPWLPLSTEVAEQLSNDEQMVRLDGTGVTAHRVEAPVLTIGEQLVESKREQVAAILEALPPAERHHLSSQLLRDYGPLAEATSDTLDAVLTVLSNPAGAVGPDEAPSAPEPPEADDEVTVPTELLVAAWDDDRLTDYISDQGLPVNGSMALRRRVVVQHIIDRRRNGEQEAWDLG